MNRLLVGLVLVLLPACHVKIAMSNIEAAEAVCKSNGGVSRIHISTFDYSHTVTCVNGARFPHSVVFSEGRQFHNGTGE